MSTIDGSPAPRGMHPAAKVAIGIGIGCAVIAALCCGVCSLGYFKTIQPMAEKFENAQRDQQATRAAQRELEALDVEFPPTLSEVIAEAVITEDQLARYARIRSAMAEPLARVEAGTLEHAAPQDPNASPLAMMRAIAGLVTAQIDVTAEWSACVEEALVVLRREGMGPTDLARLTEIVEWRYLKRPEARSLGLPPAERREMQVLLVEARVLESFSPENMPPGMKIQGHDAEQMKARLALVKQRLEELRAQADLDVALSGPTLGLLDQHRGELEALPAEGVALLAGLTQPSPIVDALQGLQRASWEASASTPSAPEAQPPVPEPGEAEGTSSP